MRRHSRGQRIPAIIRVARVSAGRPADAPCGAPGLNICWIRPWSVLRSTHKVDGACVRATTRKCQTASLAGRCPLPWPIASPCARCAAHRRSLAGRWPGRRWPMRYRVFAAAARKLGLHRARGPLLRSPRASLRSMSVLSRPVAPGAQGRPGRVAEVDASGMAVPPRMCMSVASRRPGFSPFWVAPTTFILGEVRS